MKKNFLMIIIIIFGIIILFLARTKYSDHNLKKIIGACILAQTQTSKSLNPEQARKLCEEKIKKQVKNSK